MFLYNPPRDLSVTQLTIGAHLAILRVGPILPLLLFVALLAGCGSSPSPGGPSGPNDGGAPPSAGDIVGGELIGWDQLAPSVDAARAYTYTLYVDDNFHSVLGGVACDPSVSAVGYRCSAVLPTLTRGGHSLQISSKVGDQESARSAPISVNVR